MSEFESTTRENGSKVTTQPYSRDNIKWLKRLVYDSFKEGNPRNYDVRINGEVVVHRTNDSRRFDGYLKYLNDSTQFVEVRLYQGNSPNCNKYKFVIERTKELSGTPSVAEQIQKAIEEDRRKRDNEDLQTEVKKLRRKLKKSKVAAQKGQPMQQLRGLLSEVGAAYSTFKGVRPLAGVDQANIEEQTEDNEDYTEVEVEVESDESQADQVYKMVKEKLGEQNTIICYQMINELGQYPELFNQMQQTLARKKQEEQEGGES